MSDFHTYVTMLRGQVSDMLCDNPQHAMWVLADLATRIDASLLCEHVDEIDADANEVRQFFQDMADLIEAGLEAEAAQLPT